MIEAPRLSYRELTVRQAEQIVDLLGPWLTEARRARIDAVLAQRTRDVVLVLEEVFTDHNRAAVLRTADAFGLVEVHHVCEGEGAWTLSRGVSLGSEKWMELQRHAGPEQALDALSARGFQVWAAAVHDASAPVEAIPVDGPVALVFGNEHAGLSRRIVASAHRTFHLPMFGFAESFNVSVAAALSLGSVLGRRRASTGVRPLASDDAARLRACWYVTSVRAAPNLLAGAGLPTPVMSTGPVEARP